jgi:hypothetical protein
MWDQLGSPWNRPSKPELLKRLLSAASVEQVSDGAILLSQTLGGPRPPSVSAQPPGTLRGWGLVLESLGALKAAGDFALLPPCSDWLSSVLPAPQPCPLDKRDGQERNEGSGCVSEVGTTPQTRGGRPKWKRGGDDFWEHIWEQGHTAGQCHLEQLLPLPAWDLLNSCFRRPRVGTGSTGAVLPWQHRDLEGGCQW